VEGFAVILTNFRRRTLLFFCTAVCLAACSSGPKITRTQDLSESADTPYRNILVIALMPSFDSRWELERYVVKGLAEIGTDSVASTSKMDTTTPVTRQTFLAMVEEIDADAVLITQVVSFDSMMSMKDMNPETTVKFSPTYYFNVWEVEVTEYVEPQSIEVDGTVRLATQLYSVRRQEAVWAIESKIKYEQVGDPAGNYTYFVDEANAIVAHLSKDGLIAQ
jgi:hypothetical protein